MTMFTKPEPLNDAELDRLGAFLRGCKGGRAMNLVNAKGVPVLFCARAVRITSNETSASNPAVASSATGGKYRILPFWEWRAGKSGGFNVMRTSR